MTGLYRVHYDDNNWQALITQLKEDHMVSSLIILMLVHLVSKNSQNCFWHNFVKFPRTLIIFWHKDSQGDIIMYGALIYHLT